MKISHAQFRYTSILFEYDEGLVPLPKNRALRLFYLPPESRALRLFLTSLRSRRRRSVYRWISSGEACATSVNLEQLAFTIIVLVRVICSYKFEHIFVYIFYGSGDEKRNCFTFFASFPSINPVLISVLVIEMGHLVKKDQLIYKFI